MRIKDTAKEENIRQKAIEMIVREGLQGFGINKLAKAADVSPATIYIYFKDKEDLIATLCMDAGTAMTECSLKGFDPDMPFEEGLRIQWRNRMQYFLKHPVEMEFLEMIRYTEYYQSVSQMMSKAFGSVMARFMNNAFERGELVKLPFEVYWAVAFAPLYQLIKFHTQGKSYMNITFKLTDEAMESALVLVLKGLKP